MNTISESSELCILKALIDVALACFEKPIFVKIADHNLTANCYCDSGISVYNIDKYEHIFIASSNNIFTICAYNKCVYNMCEEQVQNIAMLLANVPDVVRSVYFLAEA